MQHGADVERDALPQAAAVGEDLDEALLPTGRVDSDEAMVERRSVGTRRLEAVLFEARTQCCGNEDGLTVVHLGEQIHVLGEPGHEAVHDHRRAAGESERAGSGRPSAIRETRS
jgi:hypothetical protein